MRHVKSPRVDKTVAFLHYGTRYEGVRRSGATPTRFLTLVPETAEWSASLPGVYPSVGKKPPIILNRRLRGPLRRFGRYDKNKNPCSCRKITPNAHSQPRYFAYWGTIVTTDWFLKSVVDIWVHSHMFVIFTLLATWIIDLRKCYKYYTSAWLMVYLRTAVIRSDYKFTGPSECTWSAPPQHFIDGFNVLCRAWSLPCFLGP
jgi:hypothetical protein